MSGGIDRLLVCPLGAIVASCELVDVVPMVERIPPQDEWRDPWTVMTVEPWPILTHWRGFGSAETVREFSRERPYGDFQPGRFAWMLDDIKPTTERCPACWGTGSIPVPGGGRMCSTCEGDGWCDPIPAKGRQGLWNWTP